MNDSITKPWQSASIILGVVAVPILVNWSLLGSHSATAHDKAVSETEFQNAIGPIKDELKLIRQELQRLNAARYNSPGADANDAVTPGPKNHIARRFGVLSSSGRIRQPTHAEAEHVGGIGRACGSGPSLRRLSRRHDRAIQAAQIVKNLSDLKVFSGPGAGQDLRGEARFLQEIPDLLALGISGLTAPRFNITVSARKQTGAFFTDKAGTTYGTRGLDVRATRDLKRKNPASVKGAPGHWPGRHLHEHRACISLRETPRTVQSVRGFFVRAPHEHFRHYRAEGGPADACVCGV